MNKANCDPAKSPKWGVELLAVKVLAGGLTPDHGLCKLHTVHTGREHAGVTIILDFIFTLDPVVNSYLLTQCPLCPQSRFMPPCPNMHLADDSLANMQLFWLGSCPTVMLNNNNISIYHFLLSCPE